MESSDQVQIQVKFTIIDEDGTPFTDALYMPRAEYEAMTAEQLDTLKQERFTAWKSSIQLAASTPPVDPIITVANIDLEIENLTQQRESQVQQVASDQNIPVEVIEQQVDQKIEELKNPEQDVPADTPSEVV